MSSPIRLITKPLLGTIEEICIVTPDLEKTIDGLAVLGISPFQIYDFNKTTVEERQWKGAPGNFTLKVAFAKQADLVIEIMQPTGGQSLMADYLRRNNGREGIQHVAFDMGRKPMTERRKLMRDRGIEPAMEGVWKGKTVFETIEFSDDWQDPPCEWYPFAPEVEHGQGTDNQTVR